MQPDIVACRDSGPPLDVARPDGVLEQNMEPASEQTEHDVERSIPHRSACQIDGSRDVGDGHIEGNVELLRHAP